VDSALKILGLSAESLDSRDEHLNSHQIAKSEETTTTTTSTNPTVSSVSDDSIEDFRVQCNNQQQPVIQQSASQAHNGQIESEVHTLEAPLNPSKSDVKSANDLCKIFGVSNTKVFDGGTLELFRY